VQQSSGPATVIVIVALVAISLLVRRGRRQSKASPLAARERIRPLAITLLDPVVSIVIIGPFVWHLVSHSTTNVIAASAGGAIGVAIGYARAQVMFVRAMREIRSVVLRRSGWEYGLVLILVILRTTEGSVERSSSAVALSVVTALASLALIEAFARSGFIVKRYLASPIVTTPTSMKTDPPLE
jgi:hypothetical protein